MITVTFEIRCITVNTKNAQWILIVVCLLPMKETVMGPFTSRIQGRVSRIGPLKSSPVPLIMLWCHKAWLHKDAHFLPRNSCVLTVAHALGSSTQAGLPEGSAAFPQVEMKALPRQGFATVHCPLCPSACKGCPSLEDPSLDTISTKWWAGWV